MGAVGNGVNAEHGQIRGDQPPAYQRRDAPAEFGDSEPDQDDPEQHRGARANREVNRAGARGGEGESEAAKASQWRLVEVMACRAVERGLARPVPAGPWPIRPWRCGCG